MDAMDIIIGPTGDVQIKVDGCIKGKKCMDVSAAIEKALGTTVKDDKTKEYHERPTTQHRNQT